MARKKEPVEEFSLHPEIKGILLLASSAILLLSLVSFVETKATDNWLGFVGYALAWTSNYLVGLGSYLVVIFSIWVGFRLLCNKPIEGFSLKCLYFSLILFSFCLLMTLIAECYPQVGAHFRQSIYTQSIHIKAHVPIKKMRYYLGGVPAYYLFKDLPKLHFQRLLGHVGVTLVFGTLFIIAFLLLTEVRLMPIVYFLRDKAFPSLVKGLSYKKVMALFQRFKKVPMPPLKRPILNRSKPKELPNLAPKKEKKSLTELLEMVPTRLAPQEEETPLEVLSDEEDFEEEGEETLDIEPVEEIPEIKVLKRKKAIEEQKVYNGDFTHYNLPGASLLTPPKKLNQPSLKRDLRKQAEVLEETLLSFGIEAKVGEIHCGPTITSFEVHPSVGVKVQKIKALENDIALNLQAKSIRIIAPIPGKAVVGIEIPSQVPQEVNFKEMLEEYIDSKRSFHIPIILGKTVTGDSVMTDLVRMPHCIIAGATGTGKSVCINTIVMSILMNCKPDEVKLVLVDPKKVELTPYSTLPHMLAPVITEPEGAIAALKWMVKEMEKRYEILKLVGARNIAMFNTRKPDMAFEQSLQIEIPSKMYYIVCIIDELADLMMLSSNEIEMPIARIAQMARAVGIHMILATQRPSREVITGLIKANFPSRISFKVASRINSQIVLDEIGAESLLGNGDMLFLPPGASTLVRTQGCYVRDGDIHEVVKAISAQAPPCYLIDSFDQLGKKIKEGESPSIENESLDPLYDQALDLVQKTGSISTTFLQRKLKIGYARAASIMDQLEDEGVIGPPDGAKPRKLLTRGKSLSESDYQ